MSLAGLLVLYFACGAVLGLQVLRRAEPPLWRAVLHALIMVVVWPLWAPFSFMR